VKDKEILALLREKDPRGMEALVARYSRLIRYVVGGILPNAHDAEECVSDVWMSMWEKAEHFDESRGSLTTYLTAVARNAAINAAKAAARRTNDPLSEDCAAPDTPEDALLRAERARALQAVIDRLQPKERDLFYRKYYYMQSTRQMAAELSLPERAVEGRLYRLRKRLQNMLGGDFRG